MVTMIHNELNLAINRYPLDDFEGFSPHEMYGLIYFTYDEEKSPMILNVEIDDQQISQIKFINDIIQYLGKLREQQPLKLTQKGNLPRKLCRELCDLDYFEDESTKNYYTKHPIMREDDSHYIHLINVFTRLLGFTRKKHGKLLLTKKCENYLDSISSSEFYTFLFKTFTRKFNWGYPDFYPESWILQSGFGFSIYLVQKYGDKSREKNFYSGKYIRAFPSLIKDFPDTKYSTSEKDFQRCYHLRVFERFLKRFGLIEIEEKGDFLSKSHFITKTDLIDKVIKWRTL